MDSFLYLIINTLSILIPLSLSFEKRVNYYKEKLDKYINQNKIQIKSSLMVAQYNSPWTLPPFRKNELLYTIE